MHIANVLADKQTDFRAHHRKIGVGGGGSRFDAQICHKFEINVIPTEPVNGNSPRLATWNLENQW